MRTSRPIVVLDFEATCDDLAPPRPQEIIEFPSVLLDSSTMDAVSEFQSFVRPVHHPKLTAFCKELTSIQQKDVDGAPEFATVLQAHTEWLETHVQGRDAQGALDVLFVTCGDWDLLRMLPAQCKTSRAKAPGHFRRWLNVKVPFRTVVGQKASGMPGMLRELGLPLLGTHHRGIDDCRNIAAILRALVQRGAELEPSSGQLSF